MLRWRIRGLAALAAACISIAVGTSARRSPDLRGPVASAPETSAGAPVEPSVPEPNTSPASGTKPPAAQARPVAFGEPAGRVTVTRGTSAPRSSWLQSAFPAQWNAQRSSQRGGNAWALIIGINDYRAPTRDNIGSYQDAVALRQYLLHLGWRSDHVLLIGETAATRDHVIEGLRWLASKTDGASMVVFHYSGHEKPFYNDPDGDGEARDVALWLSDNRIILDRDLGRLLDPVRAEKFWLNLVVCRAGGFNDPGTIKAGRLITFSSPESELSYEDPERSHSVYGYYSIVEGLQQHGADANGDGVTTVQEAFAYARPRVVERTEDRQHPVLTDRYGSSFSLVPPVPPAPPASSPSPSPAPSPCMLPFGCTRQVPDRKQ